MSLWTVELNRRAGKDFRELDFNGKESARDIMAELEEEGPAIHGAIEMRANPNTWQICLNNQSLQQRTLPDDLPGFPAEEGNSGYPHAAPAHRV